MTVTHAIGDAHDHAHDPGHAHGPVLVQGVPYQAPPPNGFTRAMIALYERSPRWAAPAAIIVCFLGAAGYVWLSNPTSGGAFDTPTCIVKLTTGLDCPGCGGTRAFYYLLHGDLAEALATALRELAGWLGLDAVAPPVQGDLARAVTAALAPDASATATSGSVSAGVTV